MKNKQINLTKLTDFKYVNMYNATMQTPAGDTYNYQFITRRDDKHMGSNNLTHIDAIKVLPYYTKDGKIYVALNKEYRVPLNYVYDICSGLVENQNNIPEEVARELWEELGAKPLKITKVAGVGHVSPGLTDETQECYFAEICNTLNAQHLEVSEDISLITIPLDEIMDFVSTHQVVVTTNLMLQLFYTQHKK